MILTRPIVCSSRSVMSMDVGGLEQTESGPPSGLAAQLPGSAYQLVSRWPSLRLDAGYLLEYSLVALATPSNATLMGGAPSAAVLGGAGAGPRASGAPASA